MTTSTYAAKYRDPRWQRRRLEIMERHNFSCQECDDTTTTLNVHHRQYRKGAAPWEYEDKELMCLCEKCHSQIHDYKKAIEDHIHGADSFELPSIHAVIVGYRGGLVEAAGVPAEYASDVLFHGEKHLNEYMCGDISRRFSDVSAEKLVSMSILLDVMDIDVAVDAILAALQKQFEANTSNG